MRHGVRGSGKNREVPMHEIIQGYRELRDAVELGQYTFPPGSRGQQLAEEAMKKANYILSQVRTPEPGKWGE